MIFPKWFKHFSLTGAAAEHGKAPVVPPSRESCSVGEVRPSMAAAVGVS